MAEHLQRLRERLGEIADIAMAEAVLSWDQHTYMPAAGSAARAEQMATLQKLGHRMLTSAETRDLVDKAEAEVQSLSPEEDDRALVDWARRDLEDALKLPEDLVAERVRTRGLALEAWSQARSQSQYSLFAPWLQKTIELERQVAEYRGYKEHPYDALLDAFERGTRTSEVAGVFKELREKLVPLARRIAGAGSKPDDFLHQEYPVEVQQEACRTLTAAIGYDLDRGRIDPTIHPFATSFSTSDVRITTRYDLNNPFKALFACLHEAGHAMYEQGMPEKYERTPLLGAASLGVHESQSRLWENLVGRSRGFWEAYFPWLQKTFPSQLGDVALEAFYGAINRVQPSLIRVEADEVTYNLHVLVRFEMELDLVEGRLSVADAPEAWNHRMQTHLGITPPDDRSGILQDVHWSMGIIGYFPTYTIGNLLSCQIWEAALEAQPSIPEEIRQGDCTRLLGWLRQNIHSHGRKYLPADLIQKATGKPLSAGPFLRYLETKYGELYGI